MRDFHGVGARKAAEFSDEESDSSTDKMAIPLAPVSLPGEANVVRADQKPLALSEDVVEEPNKLTPP